MSLSVVGWGVEEEGELTVAIFCIAILDNCPIMRVRAKVPRTGTPARTGDEPMKRAIRLAILMVGLVGTFMAAAVQQVPAADGGPLILCPPKTPNCNTTLPPQ